MVRLHKKGGECDWNQQDDIEPLPQNKDKDTNRARALGNQNRSSCSKIDEEMFSTAVTIF